MTTVKTDAAKREKTEMSLQPAANWEPPSSSWRGRKKLCPLTSPSARRAAWGLSSVELGAGKMHCSSLSLILAEHQRPLCCSYLDQRHGNVCDKGHISASCNGGVSGFRSYSYAHVLYVSQGESPQLLGTDTRSRAWYNYTLLCVLQLCFSEDKSYNKQAIKSHKKHFFLVKKKSRSYNYFCLFFFFGVG